MAKILEIKWKIKNMKDELYSESFPSLSNENWVLDEVIDAYNK